jgi:hypothetical protein
MAMEMPTTVEREMPVWNWIPSMADTCGHILFYYYHHTWQLQRGHMPSIGGAREYKLMTR